MGPAVKQWDDENGIVMTRFVVNLYSSGQSSRFSANLRDMNFDYDIIIVGAGLVGTSLISALQQQPLRIAVLEKHLPESATATTPDSRPLTLSYGSALILKNLGVWDALAPQACPIKSVHVSEQGRFGRTCFQASEENVPVLGYVVPFHQLQQRLYQTAANSAKVDFFASDAIETIHCDRNGATITFTTIHGQQQLSAKLLIAADGTHSVCRKQLNIETTTKDHEEIALTATIQLQTPHQHQAYERFTRQGVLALLPLFDQQKYRLVWTTSKTQFAKIQQWDDASLQTHLQNCFGHRIGHITSITRHQHFPLTTIIANEQVRPGFVLVGNAAHAIYPLAAQGFNLGLRDVAVLSEVLLTAIHANDSISDLATLNQYVDWRGQDQQRIIDLTAGIANLFDWQLPGVGAARGFGLLAMDMITPIKKRLAKRCLGLAGRLPQLMKDAME